MDTARLNIAAILYDAETDEIRQWENEKKKYLRENDKETISTQKTTHVIIDSLTLNLQSKQEVPFGFNTTFQLCSLLSELEDDHIGPLTRKRKWYYVMMYKEISV